MRISSTFGRYSESFNTGTRLAKCCVAVSLIATMACNDQRDLKVRTFTLQHLTPADAQSLLVPYARSDGSMIYRAEGAIKAVTVRESATQMTEIERVLKQHDRVPASVLLRFQLIEGLDTAHTDPVLAELLAALEPVLRYRGYRLVGEGIVTVTDQQIFRQTLGSGRHTVALTAEVQEMRLTEDGGAIRLHVRVDPVPSGKGPLLETGLTVPIGQTVLLGSTQGPSGGPLLVTVKPGTGTAPL